jgi:hypothetical protein
MAEMRYASAGESVIAFPSVARIATPTPFDLKLGKDVRGVHVIFEATASADTPSVTVTVQGSYQPTSKFYDLLTSTALTGVGTKILRIYPGMTNAANVDQSSSLPKYVRIIATHGDADSITYSVGLNLLP